MTTDAVAGFIREQPQTVPATYRAVREAVAGRHPAEGCATLVGSGSSLNALTAMAPAFAAASRRSPRTFGPRAFLTELVAGRIDPGPVIILSQSGASRTTIEAAEQALARGLDVWRVTAEARSPFARLGDGAIVIPIGPEPIGPKTKGYTASLAALSAIADRFAGVEVSTPACEPELVEASRAGAEALAGRAGDVDFVLVAGAGAQVGTAMEASLKISEMSGVPSAGFDLEEALHGRLHGLTARSLAIFVVDADAEGGEADLAARTMRQLGCRTCLLGHWNATGIGFRDAVDGVSSWPLDPIRAIVPFQWLASALARARGRDPAAMRYPGLSARLSIKTPGEVR